MTTDTRHPGDAAPQRIAVTSPSGIPGAAWVWASTASDPEGVAIARMTLRAAGDQWVRAEVQESLPADALALLRAPVTRELKTRIPPTMPQDVVPGPIAHDAELAPAVAGAPPTRLAGGRVTLLATGPAGTFRAHFDIVALRRSADGSGVLLDLRAVFRWPDPQRMRFLLAVDDAAPIEDQDSTLTTPADASGVALPFRGTPSPASPSAARPAGGLPFPNAGAAGHAQVGLPAATATPAVPPIPAHPAVALAAPTAAPATAAVPAQPTRPTPALAAAHAVRPIAREPAPPAMVVPALRPENAIEASDRAAGAGTRPATAGASPGQAEPGRGLELLWHAPSLDARLRTVPAWKKLLRDAESRLSPSDADWLDATEELETRWAVTQILLDAAATPAAGFRARLDAAFQQPGVVREPLARARGTLRLDFDPRARLAATCAATRTLARNDAGLADVWKPASELSAESDPLTPPIELEEADAALRAAAANATRSITADELDRRIETSLVGRRGFHAVELSGERHVRGRLTTEDGARATVYLPDACARAWPLSASLEVEAIVAIVPPRESALDEPCAAMILALARRAPSRTPSP